MWWEMSKRELILGICVVGFFFLLAIWNRDMLPGMFKGFAFIVGALIVLAYKIFKNSDN